MTAAADRVRRRLWKTIAPTRVEALEARIEELSPKGRKSWYYPIEFGYGVTVRPELRGDRHIGEANWRFLADHLPDLHGKRVLDIGCNAGLYALRMAQAGAREVVGVDFDVRQAEFVREWFGGDPERIRFVAGDAKTFDFSTLGRFDLACLFCVVYHLGDAADRVLAQLAEIADTVVLQGNLPRVTGDKYRERTHQELAGVSGMTALLRAHGFADIEVVAPAGHPKPLAIGRR